MPPWSEADFERISGSARRLEPESPREEVQPRKRKVRTWAVPSIRLPRFRRTARSPQPSAAKEGRTPERERTPKRMLPRRSPVPRLALPKLAIPRPRFPRLALPKLTIPRPRLPRPAFPQLDMPRPRLPRLALPKLAPVPRPYFRSPAFPKLALPRLNIRPAFPDMSLWRARLPRPALASLLPNFLRPREAMRRLPAPRLASRAAKLRAFLAKQGHRAKAGAAEIAGRSIVHANSLMSRARCNAARSAMALAGLMTVRHWQSGALAAIGFFFFFVAVRSATVEWQPSPEVPSAANRVMASAPVAAATADYLAQEYMVPLPLPRIAYRSPPRSVAGSAATVAAAIDVDALPSRFMLPVDERRGHPLARAETAEVQVRLLRLGYEAGPPTGRLSVRARQAIALFQRDAGLSVTGTVNQATIEHVRRASSQ